MRNLLNISALCGLAGAVGNNGKTPHTDDIVRQALLSEDSAAMVEAIHGEKFTISPSCATCASPCGNTSDLDMTRIDDAPEEIRLLKLQLVEEMARIAALPGGLNDIVYRGLSYLTYDLKADAYTGLLEEMKQW